MKKSLFALLALLVAMGVCVPATTAPGQTTATRQSAAVADTAQKPDRSAAVNKGVEYLLGQQAEDGSWSKEQGPALTAIALTALMDSGRTVREPAIAKGLDYLKTFVQPDGGVYAPGSRHKNYETCLAMMCFTQANKDGQFAEIVKGMDKFIRGLQWDETEDLTEGDYNYGGAGYGGSSRPDLSNTQFFIEALKAAGAGQDDPAIQKALIFVSRTQNLESEHNTTPFAAKINDGGFYYTPAAGGTSQLDAVTGTKDPNGGLRSYGSMTYAGLKSMIYAGVSKDDPRVKAAMNWLAQNYSVSENPGVGAAGLYYYYQTFAKSLAAVGEPTFTSADGTKHNWCDDLVGELARRQNEDGSWVNQENNRWMEGNPVLVTSYALMSLANCAEAK